MDKLTQIAQKTQMAGAERGKALTDITDDTECGASAGMTNDE